MKIGSRIKTNATGAKGTVRFVGRYYRDRKLEKNIGIEFDEEEGIIYMYDQDQIFEIPDWEDNEKDDNEDEEEKEKIPEPIDDNDDEEYDEKESKEEPEEKTEESKKAKAKKAKAKMARGIGEKIDIHSALDINTDKDLTEEEKKELINKLNNDKEEVKNRRFYVHRIKNILKDNKVKRTFGGQRSGDLDFKKIYRSKLTDRLFRKPISLSDKQYNVSLIVDCSGSMRMEDTKGTTRAACAAQATRIFVREFQQFVNLEVSLFNTVIKINKFFNSKPMKEKEISDLGEEIIISSGDRFSSYNFDAVAIDIALNHILSLEGKNIIVVLSDGEPAGNKGIWKSKQSIFPKLPEYQDARNYEYPDKFRDEQDHLKYVVNKSHRRHVPVIGIGINTRSVERYYDIHECITNPGDIYKAMVSTLSRTIRRL